MANRFDEQVQLLTAAYERQRAEFAELRQRVAAASSTVTSKNRMITVTVDAGGEITSLKFNTQAYRSMAQAELATAVLETIQEASQAVRSTVEQAVAPMLPSGMSFADATSGEIDWDRILPEKPLEPDEILRSLGVEPPPRPQSRGVD